MSNLKKLASDTAIYGISSIGGRLLNYLLVPFYTSVFQMGEYGVVTELYAYVAFLNIIYLYGLETAYFRFANKYKTEEPRVYNSATTSLFLSSILFSGTLCLFASPIVEALEYPEQEHYIYLLASVLLIDAIVAIPFARLRFRNKAIKFASARLGNIVLNIAFNIFFLVVCADISQGKYLSGLQPFINTFYRPDWGIEYVFLSNLLANAAWILMLWPQLREIRFQLDKHYWKQMLVYAYPLLFMGIAGTINEMMSRGMLKYILPESYYPELTNEEVLGIFGACYKLSIFMNLVIQAFRFASEPFFFSKAENKESPALFAQVMRYFVIACCFIFVGVSVNLHWIGPLFLRGEGYWQGLFIVPVLLLGYLFFGIYMNLTIWFKLSDKNHYGTWFTLSGAILTVILNLTLIPTLGILGAALTTFLVYFFMAALCYWYGQRHYPIPYHLSHALVYIGASAALVWAFWTLNIENVWVRTAVAFAITLIGLAGVFLYEKKHFSVKAA